jgi:hypothetical protein
MHQVAIAIATIATVVLAAEAARACAVCAAGDPTLYAMGSEGSFAGRVRGSVSLRVGDAWIGEPGIDALTVKERRLDFAVVWAPLKDVSFSADMPILDRTIRLDHVGSLSAFAPGDLELRARDTVWTSREDGWRQALAFHGGLKLPTAPLEHDPNGVLLPPDLQPGCSSFAPILGVAYVVGRGMISFDAATSVFGRTRPTRATRSGPRPRSRSSRRRGSPAASGSTPSSKSRGRYRTRSSTRTRAASPATSRASSSSCRAPTGRSPPAAISRCSKPIEASTAKARSGACRW